MKPIILKVSMGLNGSKWVLKVSNIIIKNRLNQYSLYSIKIQSGWRLSNPPTVSYDAVFCVNLTFIFRIVPEGGAGGGPKYNQGPLPPRWNSPSSGAKRGKEGLICCNYLGPGPGLLNKNKKFNLFNRKSRSISSLNMFN